MATRRTTFGKMQREQDKRAKAAAKRERRAQRSEDSEETDAPAAAPQEDQEELVAELARLHAAYDDGAMELEEFMKRRDEIQSRLTI